MIAGHVTVCINMNLFGDLLASRVIQTTHPSFQSSHPSQVIKTHEVENLLEFIFQFSFLHKTAVAHPNLCDYISC